MKNFAVIAAFLGTSEAKVRGTVAPGFEDVLEAYQRFEDVGQDLRSQLSVYVGEEQVIDLWIDTQGDYSPDHLQTVFSSGKSVAAILMGMMADQGYFRWDDYVTDYWKGYGKFDKGTTTIAEVMRHEAGLPSLSKSIDLLDM